MEGVTEVKAIQQFLRLLRKDHQVVVLPLGGAQFITAGRQAELSELSRISKKVHVLIDSERAAQGASLSQERSAFIADCEKLGFKTHTTERRAFENYLTEQAIKSVKGANFKALGPFDLLKGASTPWAKSDNWRIARQMTEVELMATDIGRVPLGLVSRSFCFKKGFRASAPVAPTKITRHFASCSRPSSVSIRGQSFLPFP